MTMELDELKEIWKETSLPSQSKKNIMEMIQHKSYGPLAALKRTYRKQIVAMCLIPFILFTANLQYVDRVLSSILFWAYVVFCFGIIVFASYNYRIVKKLQKMDGAVKSNVIHQIKLLEDRARQEVMGLRIVVLFFIALVEVIPYFQHSRMLDKWHSLSLFVRVTAYIGILILQFVVNRRLQKKRVISHLDYLKKLIQQME